MRSPELSVIICTRNRLDKLERCVDALLSLTTHHEWELIVVDNDSKDGTSQYLLELSSGHTGDRGPGRVIHLFEPRGGLAAARNRGWHSACADVVAFTDDDCYPAADYVDSVLSIFQERPDAGFAGGRILLFDPEDQKITIQESQQSQAFWPRTFMAAGIVQGANMAFRRTALERIGGFDERLGHGTKFSCEDIDALAAVLWAGIPGVYDPRPVVFHHHGRKTEAEVMALMRSYDDGRGAYYAKYILLSRSRSQYARAWLRSIRSEFAGSLRKGHMPLMQRSRREFLSCMRYCVMRLRYTSGAH